MKKIKIVNRELSIDDAYNFVASQLACDKDELLKLNNVFLTESEKELCVAIFLDGFNSQYKYKNYFIKLYQQFLNTNWWCDKKSMVTLRLELAGAFYAIQCAIENIQDMKSEIKSLNESLDYYVKKNELPIVSQKYRLLIKNCDGFREEVGNFSDDDNYEKTLETYNYLCGEGGRILKALSVELRKITETVEKSSLVR